MLEEFYRYSGEKFQNIKKNTNFISFILLEYTFLFEENTEIFYVSILTYKYPRFSRTVADQISTVFTRIFYSNVV